MKLVGAGLRHHVDDPAARSSVLGAVIGRQHLKFADSIHAQKSAACASRRSKECVAIDFHAVQKPPGLVWTRSGNRHSCPKPSAHFSRTGIAQRDGRGLHQRQLREVASVERQFGNSLLFDNSGYRALRGLDDRRISGDDDLLIHGAYLHRQRQICLLAHR